MKESKTMHELHEIREKHYNERKNLSPDEYISKINEGADKARRRIEAIRAAKSKAA